MNKIEQLIEKLCPNGVEFKAFKEIGVYVRGVTYKKSQEIPNCDNGIKVLRANNIDIFYNRLNFNDIKTISSLVKIKENQYLKENDILICAGSGSKEHIGKVAFISQDLNYVFGGFMGVLKINNPLVSSRYAFHILTSSIFKIHLNKELASTTINNLSSTIINDFKIPIPPLEIQQEIVRILDTFTELNAELNTELNTRKKQYSYYRNYLLDFGTPENPKNGVEFKALGEVCKIYKGSQLNKMLLYSNGKYPVINGGILPSGYWDNFNEEANTITISQGGASAGYVNFIISPFWAGAHCYVIKQKYNDVLYRYVYFFLKKCQNLMMKSQFGAGIPALNKSDIESLKIPIPPLEIQQEIVRILDQFEALTSDLCQGLPAEIEARNKQYEYYRAKLLSFKEL
ncbi:restriction endonuclease subunit S [Campylobacter sp.]|uniref:restriction endonuclease subunit S n=1 Tax=Campylobacter sp. TaxID=205 RepID=UPI0025C616C6|nr:restriction endonuclease subunit S [Campylobacter sp.]